MGTIFDTVRLGNIQFKNRILRSSIGGRMCNYDGTLTDVWKNFEKRFARGGIGAVVSTTFHVNRYRVSPLQYPSIADDRNVRFLRRYLPEIQANGCRYIVQIGDPGYATQTSLFPEPQDALTSSDGWDFNFGYNDRRVAMTEKEILQAIGDFGRAARRVRDAHADGIEITAAKGYLIHQFLSPAINCRTDAWGGDADRRFRFLAEVLREVRKSVGNDFLLGVRVSHNDFTRIPWNFRVFRFPREDGNGSEQMRDYAARMRDLGVDYLHVCGGFGFPNPFDIPGRFPTDEIRMHFNATRHLGRKACIRSIVFNSVPLGALDWALNLGWQKKAAVNLEGAIGIRDHLGEKPVPIIVNGGFQAKADVQNAIDSGMTMVSMARALIANRFLLRHYRRDEKIPRECTYCSRCVGRTSTGPLGCYEISRFPGATPLQQQRRMQKQIMRWNQPT